MFHIPQVASFKHAQWITHDPTSYGMQIWNTAQKHIATIMILKSYAILIIYDLLWSLDKRKHQKRTAICPEAKISLYIKSQNILHQHFIRMARSRSSLTGSHSEEMASWVFCRSLQCCDSSSMTCIRSFSWKRLRGWRLEVFLGSLGIWLLGTELMGCRDSI